MEAKRKIHKFNFDEPSMVSGAKTHVALVDKAANMTEVLTMKSSTYVENTQEVRTYNDDGSTTYSRDSQELADHGGEYIHITDRKVRVIEQMVKVR